MATMRKPSIMIAFGLPAPFGDHGDDEKRGEDKSDREPDGEDGESDLATEAIESILWHLKNGKSGAVRLLRAFSAAVEEMCDGFMEKDYHRVGEAADAARDAMHQLISED
jgi:hypothetical protein